MQGQSEEERKLKPYLSVWGAWAIGSMLGLVIGAVAMFIIAKSYH